MSQPQIGIEDRQIQRLLRLTRQILKQFDALNAEFALRYRHASPPWFEVYGHICRIEDDLKASLSDRRVRRDYALYKRFQESPVADMIFAKGKLERLLSDRESLTLKLNKIHKEIEQLLEENRQGKVTKFIQRNLRK